jgi:hypothetical protein
VSEPSDAGKWEALIGLHSGIEYAEALVDGTPEDAVYAAMARGFQKYGPHLDFTQWTMRAEWASDPSVLRTVYLRYLDGKLERIPSPPDRRPPMRKGRR